jgi:hypothetical protein
MSKPLGLMRRGLNVGLNSADLNDRELSLDNGSNSQINPIIQQPGDRRYKTKCVVLSWNIRGLCFGSFRSREKIEIIERICNSYGVDVVFLQETHLSIEDVKWFNSQMSNFVWFHSVGIDDTRGASVGIRKAALRGSKVEIKSRDKVGRWVIVSCVLYGVVMTLASIYVPQYVNKIWTLDDFSDKLKYSGADHCVIGGDFNINFVKDEFEILNKWLGDTKLEIVENAIPTYGGKSIIDYIARNRSFPIPCSDVEVLCGNGLDHSIMVASFKEECDLVRKLPHKRLNPNLCESKVVHEEAVLKIGKFNKDMETPTSYLKRFASATREILESNLKVINNEETRKSLAFVVSCLQVSGPENIIQSAREDPFVLSIVEEFKGFDPLTNKAKRRKWKALVRKKIVEMQKLFGIPVSHLLPKSRKKLFKVFGNSKFPITVNNVRVENLASAESLVGDFWEGVFQSERKFSPDKLATLLKEVPRAQGCENDRIKVDKFKLRKIITKKNNAGCGPDGYPFVLFSSSFDLLEDVWCSAVEGIANGDFVVEEDFGEGLLILAPKAEGNITVSDFRPIAVTNVIYRLIMKYFSIDLRDFLSDIISVNQRALLRGRTIQSAVRHIIDGFYRRIHEDLPTIFVKTDFSKAFNFLNRTAIRCILQWVNTPKYLIRVAEIALANSKAFIPSIHGPIKEINMISGVRQGCPISPLLPSSSQFVG